MDELLALLSSGNSALILIAPSMFVGLLVIGIAYRLLMKLGGRFLEAQDRQATAFEQIASTVHMIQRGIDKNIENSDDIRISLAVMSDKIDSIFNIVNKESEYD